jgi:magnesium transporter
MLRLAQLFGPELREVLRDDPEQVRELLEELHPEDVADLVADLDPDVAALLMERLPADAAAPIFERLENHDQGALVSLMPPESVAQIASEMEADDRADFLSALPEAQGDDILARLEKVDPEAAEEVREIEKWPETSAGHLVTTRYAQVRPDASMQDAFDAVRGLAEEDDKPIYNLYVITEDERLIGILPVRDLVRFAPRIEPIKESEDAPYREVPYMPKTVREVMRTNIISVPPDMDQEEVARRMAKYDLNVMPVIDGQEVFHGLITIDDIIDVLTQEQTEDVQRIGGVEPLDVPYFQTSFVEFIKKRGVWLVILFFEEFFTQTALRYYDPVFEAVKGASYYVPLLISTGGNSGSQSSTLVIRGLAVGELKPKDWLRILGREMSMGVVLGLMLGSIGFFRVLMYPDQHVDFALTVGITLVGIVITGCTVGSMLPLLLKRAGIDPATSSTPFIASLVDVFGIIIFVHVAKVIMAHVIAGAHP